MCFFDLKFIRPFNTSERDMTLLYFKPNFISIKYGINVGYIQQLLGSKMNNLEEIILKSTA